MQAIEFGEYAANFNANPLSQHCLSNPWQRRIRQALSVEQANMAIELLFLIVLSGLMLIAIGYALYALASAQRGKKKRHPLDVKPARRKSAVMPKKAKGSA